MATRRPSPTLKRRRLGIELRRVREAAKLTIEEVAAALECSPSKVSRIERGQVSATPRDVRDLLELYEVDPDHREALIQLTREARQKGWWQAYSDTPVVPLVGLETAATHIQQYESMVVPGLLQTREYAEALLRVGRRDLSPEQHERWVDLRMARQALLTQENPPELWVVVEECVLRRQVHGHSVMRQQLRRLADAATLPNVTLQVLPTTAGEHAGLSGPFTIYRLPQQTDQDVVYLEHARGDLYLESSEEVKYYISVFDSLNQLALSPDDSVGLISTLEVS